jgi:hypothetical protein
MIPPTLNESLSWFSDSKRESLKKISNGTPVPLVTAPYKILSVAFIVDLFLTHCAQVTMLPMQNHQILQCCGTSEIHASLYIG